MFAIKTHEIMTTSNNCTVHINLAIVWPGTILLKLHCSKSIYEWAPHSGTLNKALCQLCYLCLKRISLKLVLGLMGWLQVLHVINSHYFFFKFVPVFLHIWEWDRLAIWRWMWYPLWIMHGFIMSGLKFWKVGHNLFR